MTPDAFLYQNAEPLFVDKLDPDTHLYVFIDDRQCENRYLAVTKQKTALSFTRTRTYLQAREVLQVA